ncbi:MAG: deaminase [Patescibacteria group bacterium]|nr:deaminase [Patescibacteria group bacterium]
MIDYPYLPIGREIRLVKPDHPHMQAAKAAARELSTEHQHPTGAVVVLGEEIIAREANQAAIRSSYLRARHADGWCTRRILKIPSGQKYWLCPGCSTHHQHAESRAARAASMVGRDLSAARLYLWGHWWCCAPCWQAILDAGIGEVCLTEGGHILFNRKHPDNQIGRWS